MVKKIKSFLKRVFKTISQPEMQVLPGQMAFFFVLSLIPLIALLGIILTTFSVSSESLFQMLTSILPREVAELLIPAATNPSLSGGLIIFFFSAFLLATNGASSIIVASNELYKVKDQDFIKRRLKAILMTIVLVSIILFMLLVPALGNSIFELIKTLGKGNNVVNVFYNIYQIVKYPITIFLIYFDVKLLYVLAPNCKIASNTTSFGAIFTTVGWVLLTEIYSFYLERFSSYDIFYGSLSNILILLLWVYLLSYIFVLGMALNSGVEETKIKETPDDRFISKLDNTISDSKIWQHELFDEKNVIEKKPNIKKKKEPLK
ncbi:MAG: YihY/virulence factor BrkB family protein [Bacilli bacterium]